MPTTPTKARQHLETIDAAAEYLAVNPRTIRRWIAAGRLTGYRVGPRLLRVDRADLDKLVNAGSTRVSA